MILVKKKSITLISRTGIILDHVISRLVFVLMITSKISAEIITELLVSMISNVYPYCFGLKLMKLIFVTCGWGLFCTSRILFIYLFVYCLNGSREICCQKYPCQS